MIRVKEIKTIPKVYVVVRTKTLLHKKYENEVLYEVANLALDEITQLDQALTFDEIDRVITKWISVDTIKDFEDYYGDEVQEVAKRFNYDYVLVNEYIIFK